MHPSLDHICGVGDQACHDSSTCVEWFHHDSSPFHRGYTRDSYQGQLGSGKCSARHRSWKESPASASRRRPSRGRKRAHPCKLGVNDWECLSPFSSLAVAPNKGWSQPPVEASEAFGPQDLPEAGTEARVGEPARFVPGGKRSEKVKRKRG